MTHYILGVNSNLEKNSGGLKGRLPYVDNSLTYAMT